MNDGTTTRMLLTTAVFAAVAALMALPAHAVLLDVEGGGASSAATMPAPTIEPGTIPYLSHGVGVDQSLFQSQTPLGLTGDGALTRGEVFQASAGTTAGSDFDWSWVGYGAGMAVLLAAAMTALYLSARRRGRVALP